MIPTHQFAPRHVIPVVLAALMLTVAAGCVHVARAESARLSPETVKHFIESFPQVKVIIIRRGTENAVKASEGGNALAVIIEAASDKTLRPEIDAAVRPHSFRDTKDWLGAARAVVHTYTYLKLSLSEEKSHRKLEKAISKIEKNGFLDDKQKRKLIDALRDNLGVVVTPPPTEDIAAVKPSLGELEALVK